MPERATRTAAATLLAVLACGAASSSGQPATSPPIVAIVLTDGKLLPLAVRPNGDWQLLPWPRHEVQGSQPSPPVPATLAAIPRTWFVPLPALPSTWKLQPINGKATTIHAASPTRWQIATFDAVGLATDYLDPDPAQRSFDFNAGIAVAGEVDTLPVGELDEASPEWAHLVARHAKSFLNADRAEAKARGVRLKGRTTVTVTKDLRGGDVSLYRVELEPKHAYEYFEVTVQRPPDPGAPRPACAAPSTVYHGLIEQRGRTETVRWLSSTGPTCGTSEAVTEVVGGLRAVNGVRLVVEYSGGDQQSFAVVNPVLGEAQMRRATRQAAVPSGHQDGEALGGRLFPR